MTNNTFKNTESGTIKRKSVAGEYAEAIFIALLLALFIRTFFVQAFKIPSGSMKRTLLIGDHILVSKYAYGIHLPNEIPFFNIKLFDDNFANQSGVLDEQWRSLICENRVNPKAGSHKSGG